MDTWKPSAEDFAGFVIYDVADIAPEQVANHPCVRTTTDVRDGVIQTIFSVSLTLDACQLILRERPDEVQSHLEGAIAALNQTIDDIRAYVPDLEP